MKRKKIITGTVLSLALLVTTASTVVFAANSEEVSSLPQNGMTMITDNMDGGFHYSTDEGDTWVSEDEYLKTTTQVDWWTYEEYLSYMEQNLADMQSLIGTDAMYKNADGEFVPWTETDIEEARKRHQNNLESIKDGDKIAIDQGVMLHMSGMDLETLYEKGILSKEAPYVGGALFDGETGQQSDYRADTFEELTTILQNDVDNGKITKDDMQALLDEVSKVID